MTYVPFSSNIIGSIYNPLNFKTHLSPISFQNKTLRPTWTGQVFHSNIKLMLMGIFRTHLAGLASFSYEIPAYRFPKRIFSSSPLKNLIPNA